jgi:hypothetical protein
MPADELVRVVGSHRRVEPRQVLAGKALGLVFQRPMTPELFPGPGTLCGLSGAGGQATLDGSLLAADQDRAPTRLSKRGESAEPPTNANSIQLRVLRLGSDQDRNVGIGVLP